MGADSTPSSGRITLEDILLPGGALQTDDAFGLELPDDGDNLLLGALYFLDLNGTQRVHILAEHFGAALTHRLQHVVFHLLAGSLERDSENLAIHFRQYFLDGVNVEEQQVFKNKHQVANGFDQVGIHLFDVFRESPWRLWNRDG